MDSVILLLLLAFCLQLHAFYVDEKGDDNEVTLEKRGMIRPFAFPCNGYDHLPRCLHGGKGPSKRRTKSGRFCVCLCNSKWVGPECRFVSESARNLRGKRTNYYGPWSILGLGSEQGKRTEAYGPDEGEYGQDMHVPYRYMGYLDSQENKVPGLGLQSGKRSMPWVILNKSPSTGWHRNYDVINSADKK